VSVKILFGTLNVPRFSRSCKLDVIDDAYEHFDFLTVEENIYSNRTAIKRPLTRRHYATSRKVADSIPYAVTGIFH